MKAPTRPAAAGAFGPLSHLGWNGCSQLVVAASSIGALAVLTSVLGVEAFGVYAGTAALSSVLFGLATLGAPESAFLHLAQGRLAAREVWGRALGTVLAASTACLLLLVLLRHLILPDVPARFVLTLAASEFTTHALTTTNARMLQALDRFGAAAISLAAAAAAKAVAALVLIPTSIRDLDTVALLFLITALPVAVGSSAHLARLVGRPALSLPTGRTDLGRGVSVAVGQTSLTISSSIDQSLLLRAGLTRDAGLYGLGVRVVSYSLMPVWAALGATYPRFFRAGVDGVESTVAFARRLAGPLLAYVVVVGGLLLGLAPVIEGLLGSEFDGVRAVIVAFAGFPLLRVVQSLLGDVLTGVGRFADRTVGLILSAAVNVGLNLWLIPRHGWRGAAAATYAAELCYIAWLALAIRRARTPQGARP